MNTKEPRTEPCKKEKKSLHFTQKVRDKRKDLHQYKTEP